jgi:hypothetical protein
MPLVSTAKEASKRSRTTHTLSGSVVLSEFELYKCPTGKKAYIVPEFAGASTTNNMYLRLYDPLKNDAIDTIQWNAHSYHLFGWDAITTTTNTPPFDAFAKEGEGSLMRVNSTEYRRRWLPIYEDQYVTFYNSAANSWKFRYSIVEENI